MRYLDNELFLYSSEENIDLYCHKGLESENYKEIQSISYDKLKSSNKGLNLEDIKFNNGLHVLFKTRTLKHRNERLKATLGIKRLGTYIRSVAAIDNHIKLLDCQYIPKILGYGYVYGRLRLTKKVLIITEFKENTYNLKEFIEKFPNRIEKALDISFTMIKGHLNNGFIHLDLWMGNIIVNEELTQAWLIDLEYLKFNPKRSLEEKLGFCLGYFFSKKLSLLINEEKYLICLNCWLDKNFTGKTLQKIKENTIFFIKNTTTRKERMDFFNKGYN